MAGLFSALITTAKRGFIPAGCRSIVTSDQQQREFMFFFCFLKIGCCFCYWHFLYFHYDDYNSENIRFVLSECFDHIIITIVTLCYFLISYVDDMLLQLTLGWKRQEFDLVGLSSSYQKVASRVKNKKNLVEQGRRAGVYSGTHLKNMMPCTPRGKLVALKDVPQPSTWH